MATRHEKCEDIIHSAALAAGGVGFIPLPFMDAIPITGIQITMIISLGKVFGKEISKTEASAILKPLLAGVVGRQVAGMIPVFGWLAKSGTAFTITETLGWNVVKNLEEEERERKRKEKQIYGHGMKEGERKTKDYFREKIKNEF